MKSETCLWKQRHLMPLISEAVKWMGRVSLISESDKYLINTASDFRVSSEIRGGSLKCEEPGLPIVYSLSLCGDMQYTHSTHTLTHTANWWAESNTWHEDTNLCWTCDILTQTSVLGDPVDIMMSKLITPQPLFRHALLLVWGQNDLRSLHNYDIFLDPVGSLVSTLWVVGRWLLVGHTFSKLVNFECVGMCCVRVLEC